MCYLGWGGSCRGWVGHVGVGVLCGVGWGGSWLNANWEKIDSIILSVPCHSLRNFPSTHTHPLISIYEFAKPYQLFIFGFELHVY